MEVQLTDASVTGKVSLYNGVHVLCDEIDTLTATITVTFTTCLNPADFPAAVSNIPGWEWGLGGDGVVLEWGWGWGRVGLEVEVWVWGGGGVGWGGEGRGVEGVG